MNFRVALLASALCLATAAPGQHKPITPPASKPPEDSQLYRNPTFGFRYPIPYGWVERTKEMQDESGKGEVLLAIFERPPQASGDTINLAVVIASESAANYPGLKKPEDYLGPLAELTAAKGFKTDGDPSEVFIDSRRLVRADFSRPRSERIIMHQSTLVLLAKGQIVTFTFIADSAEGVDDLIERLAFSASKAHAK